MKLNKKGFTLLEVLMIIVILGVIMAITIPASTTYFEKTKIKSEQIFVNKLNKLIDDYITLNNDKFNIINENKFSVKKCRLMESANTEDNNDNCRFVDAYQVSIKDNDEVISQIPFDVLIKEELISATDFVNPYDSAKCETQKDNNNYIEIYQDEEKVNYFRYKLSCIKSEENKNSNDWVYNSVTFIS